MAKRPKESEEDRDRGFKTAIAVQVYLVAGEIIFYIYIYSIFYLFGFYLY
jgi:hypothetical protein